MLNQKSCDVMSVDRLENVHSDSVSKFVWIKHTGFYCGRRQEGTEEYAVEQTK